MEKESLKIKNAMYNFSICLSEAHHVGCGRNEAFTLPGRHSAEDFLALRVLGGSGVCRLRPNSEFPLGDNSFCVFPANQFRELFCDSGFFEGYLFVFRTDKNCIPYPDILYDLPEQQEERALMRQIMDESREESFYRAIDLSALFSLLYTKWMRYLRKEFNKYYLFLNRSDSIIQQNTQASLGELSLANNMSPQNFRNYFKKYFDVTPKKYMKHKRLELAKQLLTTTLMQMKEIAECLGYENQYYFCNDFKKLTGVSPSKYRQDYLKQENVLIER